MPLSRHDLFGDLVNTVVGFRQRRSNHRHSSSLSLIESNSLRLRPPILSQPLGGRSRRLVWRPVSPLKRTGGLGTAHCPSRLWQDQTYFPGGSLHPRTPEYGLSSSLTLYSVINRYLTMAMVMLSCNNILSKQLKQTLVTHFFQYH